MATQQPRNIRDLIETGAAIAPTHLLTKEEKLAMAQQGTVLTIDAIQLGTDEEYGEYWLISARNVDKPIQFRLSCHPARDDMISSLAAILSDGPVTGLVLTASRTRNGNDFYQLDLAPSE